MSRKQKQAGGFAGKWRDILRPYRASVFLLSFLSIFQAVLQVAMALLMRYVIDAAVSKSPDLSKWIVLLTADLILQILVHSAASWKSESTTDKCIVSLRAKLMESAAYSTDVRLQGFHSGALLSRGMEDVRTLCDSVVGALPALLGQVARLISAFAAVLLLYPAIAGILVIVSVLTVIAVGIMRPVLKRCHRSVRKADEKVISVMQEDLQQLELIQSLGVEEEILRRFDKRQKVSLKEKRKRRVVAVGSNALLNIATMFGTGALLIWGALQVAADLLSYGSLTAMLQLMGQFRSPVLSLSGLWTKFTAAQVAGERLAALLESPRQTAESQELTEPQAVVFENVTFVYPGDKIPVIQDFTMEIPLQGWTCLTGVSGKGKTTLFKLMLGLYAPAQGRVYLKTTRGEIPCSPQTRHLFAYVPQDYALFSGTVLENLRLVDPQADEKTRAAAIITAAADFLWDMPQGEHISLGENNTGLSKGQIQRLAIARAVLMERPILLLDECTSALDMETEKEVLKNLHALGGSAIVVTHRPEALQQLEGITGISMEE